MTDEISAERSPSAGALTSRIRRRDILRGGVGLGVTGAFIASAGCLSPTVGPGAARVAPVELGAGHAAHRPPRAPGILMGVPPDAPESAWAPANPAEILETFDEGRVTLLPSGQTLREFRVEARPAEVEIAKGVTYPAWTYNGTVPGPTLRCTEGDRLKIFFVNGGAHPHTIHFHGIHPANMDGVFEQVPPGGSYVYEFDAEPFGLFPYHCHIMPTKKHIEKGLYGTLIIDPPTPRPPAGELVMVMNGFDTDVDGKNEFYTVNGVANYFLDHPIPVKLGELVRVYVVNMTEFDPVNSFHLHGNMFKLFRTGTSLTNYEITDTVMLCQGERAVLEFSFKYPGKYMFHAHQSEFSELGWMGIFEVQA